MLSLVQIACIGSFVVSQAVLGEIGDRSLMEEMERHTLLFIVCLASLILYLFHLHKSQRTLRLESKMIFSLNSSKESQSLRLRGISAQLDLIADNLSYKSLPYYVFNIFKVSSTREQVHELIVSCTPMELDYVIKNSKSLGKLIEFAFPQRTVSSGCRPPSPCF